MMRDMESLLRHGRSLLIWLGVLVILGGCAAGVVWAIRSSDAEDAAWAKAQTRAFARANTICGSPPRAVIPHGSSWNFGPWLQVTCRNGTVRVIQP